LLLSLSEQFAFGWAYLIASGSVIGLIVLFSINLFKNKSLSFLLAGILIFLYGFIFILLQMEEYALLMGSIGLFIVLAIIMFLSRKINWEDIGSSEKEITQ
jgi:inner membrane protein